MAEQLRQTPETVLTAMAGWSEVTRRKIPVQGSEK
jgi:hypothetical protein